MWFKSSFTTPAVVAISFCFIGPTFPATADILHVPGDYLTIQDAIDAAMDGDEVEVHPGTYNETINFLGKAITLRSSDGPELTTIDGTGFFHVVQCVSGEGLDTVLDGFTITGGNANGPCCGSDSRGGGMYNSDSSPTVTNCTFSGNSAGFGGGVCNNVSNPTVTNCSFIENTGGTSVEGGAGGGMANLGSSPTVTNCSFIGNTGGPFGADGMFNSPQSSPTVTNCIFWDDSEDEIGGEGITTVSYSDVQGGFAGTGNIDADPLFVDTGIGDYRLSSGSPAIDAGNNWGVPIDENDYDEDGVLCELFPVDLDDNPRFNADEADFDPGCGVPVVVDMGAYEYQFDPVCQITFADLTGDGAVSTLDLLSLFAEWGPCVKGCCLADLDLNGAVNTSDLLILFANWGPCP